MADTLTVPATEFSRNFARYQDQAIEEKIINVTSHGRIIGAYLSASELAHYEELKRREREVLVVGAPNDGVIADIASAEYGATQR